MRTTMTTEDLNRLQARIRAAIGYANISGIEALGAELGYAPATFKKRFYGQSGDFKRGDLLAIAELTRVPLWFLEAGWEGAALAGAPADQVLESGLASAQRDDPTEQRSEEPGHEAQSE